ncbi:MAG: methyltransferase domain-containing protein [Gemmatimonadaceae bacterium]|nr:methyltransferase domain-containing protein [Gemmatimonadaceae bacterium]
MTNDELAEYLVSVRDYYERRLRSHGPTAQGVDWNGTESQVLRFRQLTRLVDVHGASSLNDYGCGYGALLDFLVSCGDAPRYTGYDISPDMLAAAAALHPPTTRVSYVASTAELPAADFTVASGVFNVRLEAPEGRWAAYVERSLDEMARVSSGAFAFNMLTSYSDPDRMRPHLFYADPGAYFELCKRRYSRNVALLHDYDLFEFTIVVRM